MKLARRLPFVLVRLTAMAGGLLIATSAFAQASPNDPKVRGVSPLLGYGIMFVLLVLVMGISLFPSKRSHQD